MWRSIKLLAVPLMVLCTKIDAQQLTVTNKSGYSAMPSALLPLPQSVTLNQAKVTLGKQLFNDKRLSKDNTIACTSCHQLNKAGTDGLPTSVGISGLVGELNTPTIFNVGFNFRQTWIGKFNSLEEQVDAPILDEREMGIDWKTVLNKLKQDTMYQKAFGALYKNGMTPATIKNAIAEYERSLVSIDAPLDRYLRGDKNALNENEKAGLQLFKNYGCITCHQGVNIGGNMFQRFGVMGNYFDDRGVINPVDLGRFNITKRERDKYVFKVPSLRNVALTAPYFHDGSVATLEKAVTIMVRYQLGRDLPNDDLVLIIAFLNTLSGKLPEANQ